MRRGECCEHRKFPYRLEPLYPFWPFDQHHTQLDRFQMLWRRWLGLTGDGINCSCHVESFRTRFSLQKEKKKGEEVNKKKKEKEREKEKEKRRGKIRQACLPFRLLLDPSEERRGAGLWKWRQVHQARVNGGSKWDSLKVGRRHERKKERKRGREREREREKLYFRFYLLSVFQSVTTKIVIWEKVTAT